MPNWITERSMVKMVISDNPRQSVAAGSWARRPAAWAERFASALVSLGSSRRSTTDSARGMTTAQAVPWMPPATARSRPM